MQKLIRFVLGIVVPAFIMAGGMMSSALAQAPVAVPADGDDFRVTLLGTGAPPPLMRRFGPATLVQAGGQTLLFDAGRGVTQRLMQVPLRLGITDKVFITHLHSDHIVGLPDLWLMGWLEAAYAQRNGPLRIWGPAGTRALTDNLIKAFDWDIQTRVKDQNLDPANVVFATTEIGEGTVYERDGVKVIGLTAVSNVEFVERLGLYDQVLSYDEIGELDTNVPVAYIDFSGDAGVRAALHNRLDDALVYDCAVGATHIDALGGADGLPGPAPVLFFAPAQAKKRSDEWGSDGLIERISVSLDEFIAFVADPANKLLQIEHGSGQEAVEQVYLDVLKGRAAPDAGSILSLPA